MERVVYWNVTANGWYDVETDTRIDNLVPGDIKGRSIRKVVTLVWDQDTDRWRDQETGVLVTGISPLHATSEFDEDVAPDNASLIGFYGSTPIPAEEWTSLTFKQVQAMIDDAFRRRIAGGSNLHYFSDPLDDNLIVPYSYHRSLMNRVAMIADRLPSVERRRPWWKLW